MNTEDIAAVQCMVLKGDLPIKISWELNGNLINTFESGINMAMTSSRISQLTIESVRASHRGIFKCIAKNSAGFAEHQSELRVNGRSLLYDSVFISFL